MLRPVPSGPISSHALEVLSADALLPICTACGTQYPTSRQDCRSRRVLVIGYG